MNRFNTRRAVLEGAAEVLDARQYRALQRAAFFRPFRFAAAMTELEQQLEEMGAITADGEIAPAVDWKAILMEFLPILLKLLGLV